MPSLNLDEDQRFSEFLIRGDDGSDLQSIAGLAEASPPLTLRDSTKDAIAAHAKHDAPDEACGFIVRSQDGEQVIPAENRAENKTRRFLIHPMEMLAASAFGTVVGVYHSHTERGPEPTGPDKLASEALNLPYVIYSVPRNDWATYVPTGYRAPLLGREWSDGISDCYSLAVDYFDRLRCCQTCQEWSAPELTDQSCGVCRGPVDFGSHWGKKPPMLYREDYWWRRKNEDGSPKYNYLAQLYTQLDFVRVPLPTIRLNDVVVMKYDSEVVPHHLGMYLGGSQLLHHVRESLSCRVTFGDDLKRLAVMVLRYRPWVKEGDVWSK